MSRDWRLYLDDLREACEKVVRYADGLDKDAFLADDKTYDAVLRNLEVIGEAAKYLPDAVKARCSEINWRKVVGLRDVIATPTSGLSTRFFGRLFRVKSRSCSAVFARFRNKSCPEPA